MDDTKPESLQHRTDAQVHQDLTNRLVSAASRLTRRQKKRPYLKSSPLALMEQLAGGAALWNMSVAGELVLYETRQNGDKYQMVTIGGPSSRLRASLSAAGLISEDRAYKQFRFVINNPEVVAESGLPQVLFSVISFARAQDPQATELSYLDFERLTNEGGLYQKETKRAFVERLKRLAQTAFLYDGEADLLD